MNQERKIRYVMQGPVQKYGRVPPKVPVLIAKQRASVVKAVSQSKSVTKTGKSAGSKN